MEGASKDPDAGSDGAVDLTREDGRERVPVASDRVGSGGCPPGVAAPWMANSESGCEGIGVFNDATRRSDIAFFISSSLDWTLGALCGPPTVVARLSDEYPD